MAIGGNLFSCFFVFGLYLDDLCSVHESHYTSHGLITFLYHFLPFPRCIFGLSVYLFLSFLCGISLLVNTSQL